MPWYAWVSVGLNVVLLACAYHYWDVARAASGRAGYWEARYDREREKYRRLVESLVKSKKKEF